MKLNPGIDLSDKGFTLIEVLVSVVLLGIAVTIVLQLFSANVRAIATSEDYIYASAKAEAKMREILDNDEISDTSFSEITDDGYRVDVSISEVLQERSENLQVKLMEVDLKVSWAKGPHEKSVKLRTLKVLEKEI